MPNRKPVSIKDVATRAGVSPATVSNVLNGRRASTTPELADRVKTLAREMGYQVDRAASQLRSGKARIITVLVPSLDNPYFTSIIAALERHVQDEGYDIIVASSSNSATTEGSRLQALLSWRPSGVVIIPNDDAFACRSLLDDMSIPYVVVDRITANFEGDSIGSDNVSGGRQAAQHLLEYGHANALVVASSTRITNIRERCEGIEQAFTEAGQAAPAILDVGQTFESVTDRLQRWLANNQAPTAVIALTNFVTLGVVAGISHNSLRIPEDISLVGYDDYSWMRAATPPITAVRQSVDEIAAQAWAAIRRKIVNAASPAQQVRLPCTLIIRGSTRRVGPQIRRAVPKDSTPRAAPRQRIPQAGKR